jgi:hypothetical protein
MNPQIRTTINIDLREGDADRLMIALWCRTRDAANRDEYDDLRSRLALQLRAQDIEVCIGEDLVGEHDESGVNDDAMFRDPVCHKCSQELDDVGDCPDLCPQSWHVEQE